MKTTLNNTPRSFEPTSSSSAGSEPAATLSGSDRARADNHFDQMPKRKQGESGQGGGRSTLRLTGNITAKPGEKPLRLNGRPYDTLSYVQPGSQQSVTVTGTSHPNSRFEVQDHVSHETVGHLKEVGVANALANGPAKVGVDPQHAELKGGARLTQVQVAQVANTAVSQHIQQMNAANAQWGITQTPQEAFAQSTFRRGLCGESCDAVLAALQRQGVSGFSKTNLAHNNETHFFLQTQDGSHIIEPTWKQIVVSHREEQANPAAFAQALSRHPAVFVGTRDEFAAHIASACTAIGQPQRSDTLKGHWGL
ncbi:hypothetical protein [Burkholderia gladioli]|uniref:hypothetical protein n=1 Tax=Burkholderia gladioli TaxID=28095 RepID=UPI0016415A52|nr:hypothetical protein [Burkholderia gladioli]